MTGSKRLRSLTIVPDKLYVLREADRQLGRVIDEMGRPAYILVARQMGKTNLLLHMKRSREALGDVACYFDLSTRHPTLQSFFRAIIDEAGTALSSGEVLARINKDRKLNIEPNVEFDMHMRLLLEKARPQRLIIFLDEIDSLIGVPYSDKVLAQIRSMYFARENHKIYEHLTYVLSGVAEPADLIKDKNISPFNIGEKIYLENFSLSELSDLLRKADLDLPPSLIERVFYWTSGNPRMSWDICATLEDMMQSGERLEPQHVDTAVERVYLRDFDRAPVDHVRSLVRSDPNLRDALMSMHYGKANTLDDDVRSRLFLAGITRAGPATPDFNNRVIAEALSTDWLTRLTGDHSNLLQAATRDYEKHDYAGAVRLFEKHLELIDSTRSSDLSCAQSMQFGISLFHLQRFAEAQQRLEDAQAAVGASELKEPIVFYLASSKLRSGEVDASIPLFEEVANAPGEFEYLGKLALAGALVSSSARTYSERIINLSQDIISRPESQSDESARELTASALYNKTLAHLAVGDRTMALEALERALAMAPSDLAPGIYLKLIDVIDDPERKKREMSEVVRRLEHNLPMARRYGSTALSFSNFTLGALAAKALQIEHHEAAQRIVSLAKKSLHEPSIGRVAIRVLSSASSDSDHTALRPLIEAGLATAEDDALAPADILTLAKAGVISAEAVDKHGAFDRYVTLARTYETSFSFEEHDGLICIGQVSAETNAANHTRMQQVVEFFDAHRDVFLRTQPFVYTLYVHLKSAYYRLAQQPELAIRAAQEVIDILEYSEGGEPDLSEPALQSFIAQMKDTARRTLGASAPDRFRKIGRNQMVRYRDTRTGKEKIAKFKKVEEELRSGLYVLTFPTLPDIA